MKKFSSVTLGILVWSVLVGIHFKALAHNLVLNPSAEQNCKDYHGTEKLRGLVGCLIQMHHDDSCYENPVCYPQVGAILAGFKFHIESKLGKKAGHDVTNKTFAPDPKRTPVPNEDPYKLNKLEKSIALTLGTDDDFVKGGAEELVFTCNEVGKWCESYLGQYKDYPDKIPCEIGKHKKDPKHNPRVIKDLFEFWGSEIRVKETVKAVDDIIKEAINTKARSVSIKVELKEEKRTDDPDGFKRTHALVAYVTGKVGNKDHAPGNKGKIGSWGFSLKDRPKWRTFNVEAVQSKQEDREDSVAHLSKDELEMRETRDYVFFPVDHCYQISKQPIKHNCMKILEASSWNHIVKEKTKWELATKDGGYGHGQRDPYHWIPEPPSPPKFGPKEIAAELDPEAEKNRLAK